MTFTPQVQTAEDFERETLEVLDPSASAGTDAYRTQFGAVRYADRYAPRERRHEWLVKNVLTRAEQGMLVGASQAGKSFLALDISLAVARGAPWFGNKCRQGLVIYHAGESAKGVRDKRIPAYDKANGIAREANLPFVLLTLPLDLYSSDADTEKLIAEGKHWQSQYPDKPLELFVIDTFAAATPGADENSGKDTGSIRRRCKRLEQELGCAVLLVHHKNASGTKARGHTSMFADVENVLDVSLVTTLVNKEPVVQKDIHGRKLRVAKITKLKDGGDEREFRFTLKSVRLGQDEDGDDITSCVIDLPDMGTTEPTNHEAKTAPAVRLPGRAYLLLKAIEQAVRENGRTAPDGVRAPADTTVVEWAHARAIFSSQTFAADDDDPKRAATALKAAMRAAGEKLMERGYINRDNNWVWRTGKKLPGERRQAERETHADEPTEGLDDEALNEWLDEQ